MSTYLFTLEAYLITRSIEMCKEFPVNEIFGVVDDQHHNSLGYQVPCRLGHDAHV